MASRGQIPSEGRSFQAPGMMRHGSYPGMGSVAERYPHPEHLENKIGFQVAEIERLTRENQRLATAHVALRQDLIAGQLEMQRLQAHIGSIQTESDIQIRVLMEKIAKMEADIRAGESIKKDLQEAHKEAQSLIVSRQELVNEIEQATQELQKADGDVTQLPELHTELNMLRQEHHRLRGAFEHEKSLNLEQVERLQGMEKNLVSMAREVEKLRAEVMNAEKRARAPNSYGGAYGNPDSSYPGQGGGAYMDGGFGRSHGQMGGGGAAAAGNGMNLYGSSNAGGGAASGYVTSGAAIGSGGPGSNSRSSGGWGGSYDAIKTHPSLA